MRSVLGEGLFLRNVSFFVLLALGVLVDSPSPHNAPDVASIQAETGDPHEDSEAAEVTAAVFSVAPGDQGRPHASDNAADEDPEAHVGGDVTLEILEGRRVFVVAGLAHFIRRNYY